MSRPWSLPGPLAVVLVALASCQSGVTGTDGFASLTCTIPQQFIADGGPGKDGIPALTNPQLVPADDPLATYVRPEDRVVGIVLGAEVIAVPLNIGWWHEVVNLDRGNLRVAVTHCPLTGSSLAFDRAAVGGAQFGVSGLLYLNNLMLYDRNTGESLWPQMSRGARCGDRAGTGLTMVPAIEMTWAGWRSLHPTTRVVSGNTGHSRDYQSYPYGNYADPNNSQLLSPIPELDTRRPPKERVLGIILPDGSNLALPFIEMELLPGAVAALPVTVGSTPAVVFWDDARQAAAAYAPNANGQALTFRVEGADLVDNQTNSRWTVDGRAVSGALAGQRLTQVAENYVAYWFAWAAFHPQARLWSPT